MKNTKLLKTLRTFSKEEIKEFEKFISSPYFSRGRNLVPFFRIMKKYYPAFDEAEFNNENIFKKLFPGKVYGKNSDFVLKTLSYELVKMCEEFFSYSAFRNEINFKNYFLLKNYRRRKLNSEFEKKYEEATSLVNKNFGGGINDHLEKFLLLETYNEFCVDNKKFKEAFDTIALMDETIVSAGLMRAFRSFEFKHLAGYGYDLNSVPNISYDLIDNLNSEKFLQSVRKNESFYHPYIELNYLFYLISEYPEKQEYYFEFKKTIYENLPRLGHTEKYIMFSRMISYCVQMQKKTADRKFILEEFELYKKQFTLGVYKWSEKDEIGIHSFRNIVNCAFDLKEFDWLEKFVAKYSTELSSFDRQNLINYSYAFINYGRKKYERALENLQNIKIDFNHYKLDIKQLMFKIYFDMNLNEQAYSMLEAIRQYIMRSDHTSQWQKDRSMFLVKVGKELLNQRATGKKTQIKLFNNISVDQQKIFPDSWVAEKIRDHSKVKDKR